MKHLTALLIKFAAAAVIIEAYMLLTGHLGFTQALLLSAVIMLIAYIIGDIMILPRAGNTVAALADIVLSFFTVYMFGFVRGFENINITDAIIIAILLGIAEWFFHKYLADHVHGRQER